MIKPVGAFAAVSLALAASASSATAPMTAPCAFAQALRDSTSTLAEDLPVTERPPILDTADANLTILDLATNLLIDHPYIYRAVIDLDRSEVWLRRSGGYTGQEEWRGPLALARNADLAGCKGKKRGEVLM
ncbi:hypothetical protein ACHMW6_18720 [Pseudoduganella sp. UC29_106]|uniref:hypothetical protein n=1 Tax=Pseudoduganella sp. UC29_106 TaxID=3374553 RepID=UPI003757247B